MSHLREHKCEDCGVWWTGSHMCDRVGPVPESNTGFYIIIALVVLAIALGIVKAFW